MKAHFGKHKGQEVTDIPYGYLNWCVENIDPVPRPEDCVDMNQRQINALEEQNRNFISAAEDELLNREQT